MIRSLFISRFLSQRKGRYVCVRRKAMTSVCGFNLCAYLLYYHSFNIIIVFMTDVGSVIKHKRFSTGQASKSTLCLNLEHPISLNEKNVRFVQWSLLCIHESPYKLKDYVAVSNSKKYTAYNFIILNLCSFSLYLLTIPLNQLFVP